MENEKIEQLTKDLASLNEIVNGLKADKDARDKEIEGLKTELTSKDSVLKEASDKLAVELIENAIKEGKVKAELKEKLTADAKTSFDIVKNMLDSMPSSTASRFTNVVNSGKVASVDSEKANWTIRDYEEKDPKALAEIFNTNKEKYEEMYKEFYK